jgi:hypothetical protein
MPTKKGDPVEKTDEAKDLSAPVEAAPPDVIVPPPPAAPADSSAGVDEKQAPPVGGDPPAGDPPAVAPVEPSKKTVEAWRAELGTPDWLFAAARALKQWPIGKELEQAAYTAALDEAANVKLGG